MSFIGILIELLISLIVALILTIATIIIRGYAKQVGPTCGFYCISYCLNKRYKDVLDNADRLIRENHKAGNTLVGEIFDINLMANIINTEACRNKTMNADKIPAKVINTPHDVKSLKKYLKGNYIIIPIKNPNAPHYVVIKRIISNIAVIYNPQIKSPFISANKLIELNGDLKDTFNWEKWLKRKRKGLDVRENITRKRIELAIYLNSLRNGLIDESGHVNVPGDMYKINMKDKLILVKRGQKA